MTFEEMSGLMEFLYTHRAPSLPPGALAEVFDRLIWCMEDEGAMLLEIRELWLTSDDRGRVEIALLMDEVFPFREATQMNEVLSRIATTWPDLSPRCNDLRTRRAEQSRA